MTLVSRLPGSPVARVLLAGLLALGVGCTESDEQVLNDIGLGRLLLIDPAQERQLIIRPESALQSAEWLVESALLEYDRFVVDPLFGEPECSYFDLAGFVPSAVGRCASGLVLEATTEPSPIRLRFLLKQMTLRRAVPLDLTSRPDFDGDGVPNDGNGSGSPFDAPCRDGQSQSCDDNCLLQFNPGQEDSNQDGAGDACTVFLPSTGTFELDSDGDGFPDIQDNCVWVENPGQAGSVVLGTACEQVALVDLGAGKQIELSLDPATLVQPLRANGFLTVDFNSDRALDCTWRPPPNVGVCFLDESEIRLCGASSLQQALPGCVRS